jgi:hypothetical protein
MIFASSSLAGSAERIAIFLRLRGNVKSSNNCLQHEAETQEMIWKFAGFGHCALFSFIQLD